MDKIQQNNDSNRDFDLNIMSNVLKGEMLKWVQEELPLDQQSILSNSIHEMSKKIVRLNKSQAINADEMMKVIQCGM